MRVNYLSLAGLCMLLACGNAMAEEESLVPIDLPSGIAESLQGTVNHLTQPLNDPATATSALPSTLASGTPVQTVSLMFPPEDVQKLETILDLLPSGLSADSVLGKEQGIDSIIKDMIPGEATENGSVKPPVSDYYLQSILYKGSGKWRIWINETMLSPENRTYEQLEVVDVTKEYAVLKMTPLPPPSPAEGGIAVQQPVELLEPITVHLAPNQTYSLRGMQLIEGRSMASIPQPAPVAGDVMMPPGPAEQNPADMLTPTGPESIALPDGSNLQIPDALRIKPIIPDQFPGANRAQSAVPATASEPVND